MKISGLEYYTSISSMEPMFPDDAAGELEDLAEDLVFKALSLSGSLHPLTRAAIANVLCPMNSYYSNLIEGHDTHPIDIERAMKNQFSSIQKQRSLQLEAKAHVEVQAWIRDKFNQSFHKTFDVEFIKSIHTEFYKYLSEYELGFNSEKSSTAELLPGEWRKCEVQVGAHVGPYSVYVSTFMGRFIESYDSDSHLNKSKNRRVISIAAAHHRFAWIHPFVDGNGRVNRLFSDACLLYEGLDASGLWSMSRGLAIHEKQYKLLLARADARRWNDYDGRGNLSNKELVAFCRFFLSTAIDQIEFMSSLLDCDSMLERIYSFVDLMVARKKLKTECRYILEVVFLRGKISKKDVQRVTGKSDKTARIIAESLIEMGLLKLENNTKFSAYVVNYPVAFSAVLLSGIYPSAKEMDILKEMGTT